MIMIVQNPCYICTVISVKKVIGVLFLVYIIINIGVLKLYFETKAKFILDEVYI